jgi:WD40 repeat protein
VIQLWDAETGRQLTTLETGYGYRFSADYFFVTPDWQTVYVSRKKQNFTRVERDGKRLFRWEFDGDVRAWDLETGELRERFQHDPPRNIRQMSLSPDGTTILTGEEPPGEAEGRPAATASLWDVETKEYRTLPGRFGFRGTFSPNGETVAIPVEDEDRSTVALKLFDVATGGEKLSIALRDAIREEFAYADVSGFTPDCRVVVGSMQVYPNRRDRQTWQYFLKLWDAVTGEELASFSAEEEKSTFMDPVFSPDGGTFATVNWQGEQGRLYLFDVAERALLKTLVLTEKRREGERIFVSDPAFSPDGQCIAVVTQVLPVVSGLRALRGPDIEEMEQPRIHLIELPEGELRETLVAPQGFTVSLCFSPDGRTLATGGHGKVLLWDLTTPPGGVVNEQDR